MHELLGRTTCQALCLAARMFFNMKRTWLHLKRLPGWSLNLIKPQFEAPLKQSRDKSFSNILGYICAAPRDENGIYFNRVWKWFSESFVTVDYKNFPNYPELHVLLLFLLENEKGIYFGGLLGSTLFLSPLYQTERSAGILIWWVHSRGT